MNSSTESQAGSVPPSDTQTEETGPTVASDQTAPPPATTEAPPPAPASPVKRSKSKLKEKKQVVIKGHNFEQFFNPNCPELLIS